MASTAAPSAPFLSPRPIHRLAASAAASVVRTSSSARFRSGRCSATASRRWAPRTVGRAPRWWSPPPTRHGWSGSWTRSTRTFRPPRREDDEQVAYDLTDWDDDSCLRLLDALAAETIPYDLDGDELVVASLDEARVDEIVAAITTPGTTLTAGGPASFEAMSELFVAADQLVRDPDDHGGTAALVQGARAAAGASAPYGMDTAWWDGVVARAGALADLVESPAPDLEQVVDLASALRNELRPYI